MPSARSSGRTAASRYRDSSAALCQVFSEQRNWAAGFQQQIPVLCSKRKVPSRASLWERRPGKYCSTKINRRVHACIREYFATCPVSAEQSHRGVRRCKNRLPQEKAAPRNEPGDVYRLGLFSGLRGHRRIHRQKSRKVPSLRPRRGCQTGALILSKQIPRNRNTV